MHSFNLEWKNEQYELMGLNTNDCDILLVKNPMNFNQHIKTSFDAIYIDSFGPTPVKIENLNFKYNIKYFQNLIILRLTFCKSLPMK